MNGFACCLILLAMPLACRVERDVPPKSNPVSAPVTSQAAPAATPEPLGAEAAVAVVRDYYDAINRRDYEQAYRSWGREGSASGQTFEEFQRGFAETAVTEVEIGAPGRIEGAAGSR